MPQANRILVKSLLEVNKVRPAAGLGPVPMVGQFPVTGDRRIGGEYQEQGPYPPTSRLKPGAHRRR